MTNIISPTNNFVQGSHCGYCGKIFAEQRVWPRMCFYCGNDTYKNPIPVVVAMIRVHFEDKAYSSGWLLEQRGIDPGKGGWAFPGGYMEFGETWQQSIVRELQEEVGLTTVEKDFALCEVVSANNGNLLLFCAHKSGVYQEQVAFTPNNEVLAIKFPLLPEEQELCFPTHTAMWNKYFQKEPY